MTSPKDSVALPCSSCSDPKPSGDALTSQHELRPKEKECSNAQRMQQGEVLGGVRSTGMEHPDHRQHRTHRQHGAHSSLFRPCDKQRRIILIL